MLLLGVFKFVCYTRAARYVTSIYSKLTDNANGASLGVSIETRPGLSNGIDHNTEFEFRVVYVYITSVLHITSV